MIKIKKMKFIKGNLKFMLANRRINKTIFNNKNYKLKTED